MHDPFASIKRSAQRLGLLSGAALAVLFGAGQPADALVITPQFDPSWSTNPNQAQATAAVNAVISEYETDFSNPVTVTVLFSWNTLAGSPLTSGAATSFPQLSTFPTPANEYTLTQTKGFYTTAVGSPGATAVLQTANNHLPASYANPGGLTNNFFLPDAEYLALNGVAQNADLTNAMVGFANDFCGTGAPNCAYNYTGSGANQIDFTAVAEHEIAHALGRVDWAFSSGTPGGAPPYLTVGDFFKYTCGTGTLNPTFSQTCFSFDGDTTNPGGKQFSPVSDSYDWSSCNTGLGPCPAVGDSFDAFIAPGEASSISTADIDLMCALGWNDRGVCGTPQVAAAPEPGTLALLGSSLLGFAAWRRRRRT